MTRTARCAAAVIAVALTVPVAAAPKDKAPAAYVVSFLAPADGPDAPAMAEFAVGIEAAFGAAPSADLRITLRRDALPPPGKAAETIAQWKKAAPAVALAWAPDGRTRDVEDVAAKAHVPVIVLSPEPTRPSNDPSRLTFWAGGVRTPDEALQAMDFALLPLGSHHPALLHDGSARATDAAARAMRLHHFSQDPLAPALLAETFDANAAKTLAGAAGDGKTYAGGADAFVYFGGAAGANRLVTAVAGAGLSTPVLLGQGLASAAVPAFEGGKSKTVHALEAEAFEDYAEIAASDRPVLEAAAKAAGTTLRAATVRGYRAGRWIADALRAAGSDDEKKVGAALRAVGRDAARGRKVFDEFGRASLFRLGPWRFSDDRHAPGFGRAPWKQSPMQAIPQIGTFRADQFEWQEGTTHVQCSFGEGAVRTIEKDLEALGLWTGTGGEAESRILDDLMGRFMSRMNRLFLRNPDGTAIPGVSYKVSFTTAPPGKHVKGVKLKAFLAGDNPDTGGVASGQTATIFSTFIQRTLYLPQKLTPPIGPGDRAYPAGTYTWGASLAANLRGEALRSLVDGYSQGLSLTGAHEVGHLCGLGHDTESPRSLMNVVEAVGLDFDWAEWIPSHAKTVESFLGREPGPRD